MTDDLDALKAALRAVPAPDATMKAATLQLAMENYDRHQGLNDALRPNEDRPVKAGFLMGVFIMLTGLKTKTLLVVSTSAAALLLGVFVVMPTLNQGPIIVASKPKITVPVPVDLSPAPKSVADAEADNIDALGEIVPKPVPEPGPQPETAVIDKSNNPAMPPPTDSLARANSSRNRTADMAINDVTADPDVAAGATQDMMAAPMAVIAEPAPASAEMVGQDKMAQQPQNTEAFAMAAANPVKITAEQPVSTFSIDVDTASYAVVRSSLNAGFLPDPAAVRIEEMVNYFPYAYPSPDGDQAFLPAISVMQTPWNPNTRLVHIGIQGAMPAMADRPPLNLVFLIDTSGSMDEPNKLPLLQQSLGLMLAQLHPEDQIAIVAYAGTAGLVLPPTKASDRATITAALNALAAGGLTAGAEGLELAYQVAEDMAAAGEVSRVLLATDGDFNVGIDDPQALTAYIAKKRESGVYLSVLGFGRGNLDDATMQALAQNGNGTASYIDTLGEARKVLIDQLTGALYPIANNVKIQIEWNPETVAEYRLIGYETRSLRREDFNNDQVDAGDIGAGTQVTALYEITAPGSPALRSNPLRYGKAASPELTNGELGFLRLRSVLPGASASTLQETAIVSGDTGTDDARFAAAIAGFGQLLSGSTYLGTWGWGQAIDLALSARGRDDFGYRIEAVNLMRLAQSLDVN